jgi:ompA/motB
VKIAASGKGETQPAASETNPDGSVSEAGKAANRRVEIRWKK